VVLPYRNIEQSGVLYTALAFGRPLVLSAVGGFPEIAEQGAALTVPPEDPAALAEALAGLLADPAERDRLATGALAAAAGRYSWDRIARDTVALYERLLR
jgi:glycosyltransferase involved in cell wall biosynthesis